MEGFDALDEGVKICYVVETIHVLTEDSRARVGLYALLCQVAVPPVRYCKGQRGGREGVRAGNRQVMAPDRDCTCAAMGTNYSKRRVPASAWATKWSRRRASTQSAWFRLILLRRPRSADLRHLTTSGAVKCSMHWVGWVEVLRAARLHWRRALRMGW